MPCDVGYHVCVYPSISCTANVSSKRCYSLLFDIGHRVCIHPISRVLTIFPDTDLASYPRGVCRRGCKHSYVWCTAKRFWYICSYIACALIAVSLYMLISRVLPVVSGICVHVWRLALLVISITRLLSGVLGTFFCCCCSDCAPCHAVLDTMSV